MQDKVDAFQLHQDYILTQTPVKERAIKTIKKLKHKAIDKSKKLNQLFKK